MALVSSYNEDMVYNKLLFVLVRDDDDQCHSRLHEEDPVVELSAETLFSAAPPILLFLSLDRCLC